MSEQQQPKKGGAQGAPEDKKAESAACRKEQDELRKLLPSKTVEQLRSQYRGPILKVEIRRAAAVTDSREHKALGIEGVKLLGIHKARRVLSKRDAKLGRPLRTEGFALLACDQAGYDEKLAEIAEAKRKRAAAEKE